MKKILSMIIAGITVLNSLSFTAAAYESPYPPVAAELSYNSFYLASAPSKLYYQLGEELDFTGIFVSHTVDINYDDLAFLSTDNQMYYSRFQGAFKDISEKPETILFSDLIAHPDSYPMYYYYDASDFSTTEAGVYEIRLYSIIATTDEIVTETDSFRVMVADGLAGDTDGDETVGITDAAEVLTYYARSAADLKPEMLSNADIDLDGAITLQDASGILTYYARNGAGISCTWEELLHE